MKFQELNIMPSILKALEEENYTAPTPIQEQAIPPALQGRDVLGCAQTGTGKTCAFAVPILQLLSQREVAKGSGVRPIRALILTPTRELAIQIDENLQAYGRHTRLRSAVIFGGVSQVPQVETLRRGVDVLVATPGRLNDLIGQGYIDLGKVEFFVLDEADRMLDMGFIHDVRRVLTYLPKKRQTMFFSATMPAEIMDLVSKILVDPVRVEVTPVSSTVDTIVQQVYFVDKNNKPKLLIDLLQDESIISALVFTRTKHGADRVVKELGRANIKAQAIHGNKSQNNRQQALSRFKSGEIRVLVATDIAARGIDIDELSHVVNYNLPNVPETYVHRIGRTGRAGLAGTAISFSDFEEKAYLRDIERLIGKKVPVVEEHPYPMEVFEIPAKEPPRPRENRGGQMAKARAAQGKPGKGEVRRPEAGQGQKGPKGPGPKNPAGRPGSGSGRSPQGRRSGNAPRGGR